MLSARIVKQGFYVSGGLLLLVVVIIVIVAVFARPNLSSSTPSPTPSKYLPLKVERVDIVRHDNLVDAVAKIQNPNPHAGIGSLPVKFIFLDNKNRVLATREESSYILPGNIQYVAALGVSVTGTVNTVKLAIELDGDFISIPNNLKLPTYNSFLYDHTTKKIGSVDMEEQRGIITNNSTFDFQRVEVIVLAFDKEDKVIGVGTTFLGALQVNEQREFLVQWFKPAVSTERVVVFPVTNIFREENVIRVIGDSDLLK